MESGAQILRGNSLANNEASKSQNSLWLGLAQFDPHSSDEQSLITISPLPVEDVACVEGDADGVSEGRLDDMPKYTTR